MRAVFVAISVAVLLTGIVSAQREMQPNSWYSIAPGQLKWTKNPDGTAQETAVLFGDRAKHEMFGYAVKWPPRSTRKAHTHPEDRYAVVVSGTFCHGRGSSFDESKLEKRTAGTFFSEPGGVAHFGAAKDESVVLYFFGTGPDRTDVVEK